VLCTTIVFVGGVSIATLAKGKGFDEVLPGAVAVFSWCNDDGFQICSRQGCPHANCVCSLVCTKALMLKQRYCRKHEVGHGHATQDEGCMVGMHMVWTAQLGAGGLAPPIVADFDNDGRKVGACDGYPAHW
jgi:hypothetical protein